jgi:hypothetical protein
MGEIQNEHPEYRVWKSVWPRYRDLYTGGEQMMRNASQYLVPRNQEPNDVYMERLSRAYYENYIGSIIDWYATTLFRREPLLLYTGQDEPARKFFNGFAEDCDRKGSTLSDFFRKQLTEALVMGKSYIVADFPRTPQRPPNRAAEEAMGASKAYLCSYPATSVTNWRKDENGAYDWVVLRHEPKEGEEGRTRWVEYDRETYRVYESTKSDAIALLSEGRHGMAALGRVPLFEFTVGEGMWLMNRAATLQLEHFNKSNGLAWAMTMGLFAMPVVFSDREWRQCMGESYYLRLGKGDRFGWTEPTGTVYEIAMRNLDRLKEEIYRISYLLSQAGGSMSKNSALTGASKQRDYVITQEVLRGFGDRVKDTIKTVLRSIAEAREDRLEIDVAGLDEFDVGEYSSELEDAERLLGLGIASPTMRKQVQKKLAMKYLCDVRQEVKDQIAREIDEAA